MFQPIARDAIHAAFWIFLLLAVIFWAGWIDVPGHEDEWMLGYLSVASALALLAPRTLFKYSKRLRSRASVRLLTTLEWLLLLGMAASWVGAFGLYRIGVGYDTFVHLFASGLGTIAVMLLIKAGLPRLHQNPFLLVLALLVLVLGAGMLNELIEWGSDRMFGTIMYGESGQPNDTLIDIGANTLGVLIGMLSFWPFRKRVYHYLYLT